jgi:large conductance mechanosensitive channel
VRDLAFDSLLLKPAVRQELFRTTAMRRSGSGRADYSTGILRGIVNIRAPQHIEIMSILSEFKEFAVKGNVVDLAVGVIIGAAFGKIVDSLVADIIMPVVGLVFGKLDFSNLYVVLGSVPAGVANNLADLKKAGVPVLAYGNFITIAVNFFILAFIIFMMVKQINKLRKVHADAPAAPVAPPEDIALLREIRDSLKNRP